MTHERRSSFQYRTRAVFKTPYKGSNEHRHYSTDKRRHYSPSPERRSCETSYTKDRSMPYQFERSGSYQSSFGRSNDDDGYSERSTNYVNSDKRHRVLQTFNNLRNSWVSSSSDSVGQQDRYWKKKDESKDNQYRKRSFTSISLTDNSITRSKPVKKQNQKDGIRTCRTMYYVSISLNVVMIAFIVYYMVFFKEKTTQNWNPYFESPSASPSISLSPTGVSMSSMPSLNSSIPLPTLSNMTQNILFDFNVTCPYDVNDLIETVRNRIENVTDAFQSVQVDIDIVSAPECFSRRMNQIRRLDQLFVRIHIMIKKASLSNEKMNDLLDQIMSSILKSIPGSNQVRSEPPSNSPSFDSQLTQSFQPVAPPSFAPSKNIPSAIPSEALTASPSSVPSVLPTNVVITSVPTSEPSARPSFRPSAMPSNCDSSDERRNTIRTLIQNTSGIDYESQNDLLSLEFSLDYDFYANPCYDNSRILQRYFVANTFISWGKIRHVSYLGNECRYGGMQIICNIEGKPKIINGESQGLIGTIPRELMFLNAITELNLGWNQLNGTIPDNLYMLSNLEVFDIKNNAITGPFPRDLLHLQHLRKIDLGHLKLTGTIPEELGTLTKLEYLDFQHTTLTGSIPQSVYDLPHLEKIMIFGSALTWT